jgi:hypothetical protein
MKTILEFVDPKGKGWRIRLLSRKEAYKGIDRIRLEFFAASNHKRVWYDLQPFEASHISAGLSAAVFYSELGRLARRRASRKKAKKVIK